MKYFLMMLGSFCSICGIMIGVFPVNLILAVAGIGWSIAGILMPEE